jgi:hypothetical protein
MAQAEVLGVFAGTFVAPVGLPAFLVCVRAHTNGGAFPVAGEDLVPDAAGNRIRGFYTCHIVFEEQLWCSFSEVNEYGAGRQLMPKFLL